MSQEVAILFKKPETAPDSTLLNLQKFSDIKLLELFLALVNNTIIQSITHLHLSGVGIDIERASELSKVLQTNRTIQSIDLSCNKMSYKEMTLILDALSVNCNPLTEELGYESQQFFAHTSVMKPRNSLPLRELDISQNLQKSTESFIKERFMDGLVNFLNKNWTLGTLNLSGINTGDWTIDDITKICSGIKSHNKEQRFQSKVKNLNISCNQLSSDNIELFAKIPGLRTLVITRNEIMHTEGIEDFIEVPLVGESSANAFFLTSTIIISDYL